MKERINWIDWVKAWCMTVVVFDHTPHDGSPWLLQFLAATNLASFFFISGYLKKPISSQKAALKKYAYCLLIPYLIYNAVFYPYWLVKYYIEHGGITSFGDCLRPIIGTMLGQLNSSFSCELNGVTWFLLSLFLMHWITDVCNRQKTRLIWMLVISIIAMVLYGINKYTHFAPYLPFHGLVRCICFFFMGNICRQMDYLKKTSLKNDLLIGVGTLALSLTLFYWHIHEDRFVLHILLYFIVNILSVFAIIHLFRTLNGIRSRIITYISIGTMVIFGLHRMMIGIIDFYIEKKINITNIIYDWYECIIIALAIEIILLPIITHRNKWPILLGKKKYYA